MAESSSTGNSGTTGNNGTTGTSSTGTTSTSTSTSTSSSGAAASGSQSSSNGSFSTGNGNGGSNGGVGPGLSFGAGLGPTGTPGSLPGMAPGFTGFASSNFGQGWGNGSGGSSTNGTKTEPVMTVDEVYGKGNQSIVESQGDYEASSNEKSNVETSTFGKQDEISVTPLSVTEDKGLVDNAAIQSVEGLDFQQKDKANQEVMEAKKSRDDAEAEDNANGMRNQLKAVAEKDAFQVGEKNTFEEENNAKLAELNQKNQELENAKKEEPEAIAAVEKAEAEAKEADKAVEEALSLENRVKQLAVRLAEKEKENQATKDDTFLETLGKLGKTAISPFTKDPELQGLEEEAISLAKALGTDAADKLAARTLGDTLPGGKETLLGSVQKELASAVEARVQEALDNQQKAQETAKTARTHANEVTAKVQELQAAYETAEKAYNTWKTEYWANDAKAKEEAAAKAKAEEEAAAVETPTTEAPSYKGTIDAAINEINNSKDLTDEQKSEATSVLGNVKSAAEAVEKASSDLAANPNDANIIATWKESNETLHEALEDAKGNNALKNTNFNRTFTKAVVAAINNSKVTMPDGSTKSIAEFMTETVTRSPELAKGLYEAKAKYYDDKAKELEDNGKKGIRSFAYKTLAAIANKKSEMAMTWLGSKFTFADNQIRNQFIQLAKTNDRATYAAYNNILNDETGEYSEADKAEAFAAINQSNAMMIASTALQASTGFITGKDDSPSDGVYGVTDPGKLTESQKTRYNVSNVAKIVLGLGVFPGANEAYQNMYYIAGAKVNESGLFSKDSDSDGFALCQEYGNNAAAGMIAAVGELGVAVALTFNPATSKMGINLAIDSVKTFFDALYGVQKEVNKTIKLSNEILGYFNEAKSIAAETGNKEATGIMDSAIKQIEDFQLKSDEVGNLDNWLEGSGSNTADNGKFNQALSYDEWLKLIEADPVMQEYAKSLNR